MHLNITYPVNKMCSTVFKKCLVQLFDIFITFLAILVFIKMAALVLHTIKSIKHKNKYKTIFIIRFTC